ncbi:MAG: hypothetical protein U0L20_07340 [Ruminococcus sp.]|nr:hypothetical protein [Ruminococcus sp.]
MKIWKLDCDVDNYENLAKDDYFDLDFSQSFDGRSQINNWTPLKVDAMYRSKRPFSNTPGFLPHIPVFDEKAISVLKDALDNNAEILPLKCSSGNFYAVNVTKVLDCIDYEKSTYKTFRDGKRIMRFLNYSFDINKVIGEDLFKIKDEPLKRPFVSDNFKNLVAMNNLTGFKFELVWDSEI